MTKSDFPNNEQIPTRYASWSAVLVCQEQPDTAHGVMRVDDALQTGFCLGSTFYSVGQSFMVRGGGRCVPTYPINETFVGSEVSQCVSFQETSRFAGKRSSGIGLIVG